MVSLRGRVGSNVNIVPIQTGSVPASTLSLCCEDRKSMRLKQLGLKPLPDGDLRGDLKWQETPNYGLSRQRASIRSGVKANVLVVNELKVSYSPLNTYLDA